MIKNTSDEARNELKKKNNDQEHFRWSNENIQSIQIIQKKDVFAMYAFNKYTREKVEMKFQCTENNFK